MEQPHTRSQRQELSSDLHLDQYRMWLEKAGFVNIKERYYKRASNSWPKDPHKKEIGKVH